MSASSLNKTKDSSRMTVLRRQKKLWLMAAAAAVLAGCADDKPLNTFEPRGPRAELIDDLMLPIWYLMGVFFVVVVIGGIVLSIKNRVNGDELDPNDLPAQTHGNTKLELGWTILPAVILAGVFIPVMNAILELEERNDGCEVGDIGPDCDGLDVLVVGQQWWWEYRYDVDGDGFFVDANGDGMVDDHDRELPLELILDPDDVVTANELVVPVDAQVDLLLTSRDVIHSYWIPRLNGKRDTVPGRWTTWSLEASEEGKFVGWCTEFCGLSHARMRMSTIALSAADFDTWLSNQMQPAEVPTDPEALAGREIFQNQCMSCHLIDDGEFEYPENFAETVPLVSHAAPNLTHFATRTTFAGGIFASYAGPGTDANDDAFDVSNYVDISERAVDPTSADDFRWNSAELKRWVANAPDRKAMASDVNPETGLGRGMLPFPQLSDEELDQVVAYLATLD